MKYHSQLLKKYLSLNVAPEEIAQQLILKTCEIEEVIERTIQKTIVIGQITSLAKHPDADKLNVCQVDCGERGKYQIVCGGTNVAEGIFVPVALVGTAFPELDITIAKRAMRGIDSEGMICSKAELGIDEDKDQHWIWELGKDLEVGAEDKGIPLADKFPWLEASIFDVDSKSLSNRPDLTGHFGIAVELNAIFGEEQQQFNKIKELLKNFETTNILEVLEQSEKRDPLAIDCSTTALNSYITLRLEGIEVKPSDFFSRLQTLDLGAKPINNWVDFSNLFMNISGQPIHFFDADKINGKLHIRDAKEGESFIDLFENEHVLTNKDLVIADDEKILALWGVVGGRDSGISESSKNIIVEIANFDPVVVRKTGTRLGLRTDAELRFEKTINPLFSLHALLLFLDELQYYAKDLGNFSISGINHYIKPEINPLEKKIIKVDREKIAKLIFWSVPEGFEAKAIKILHNLGFKVHGESVEVPFWRGSDDMNIQEDIAEEIGRIWGYDNIESKTLLSEVKNQPFGEGVAIIRAVESLMAQEYHFDQVETYPRAEEKMINAFHGKLEDLYRLENPLNADYAYLRDSMFYNLLQIASKNSKFFESFKLFDIGKVWTRSKEAEWSDLDPRYAENAIYEELQLGACRYEKSVKSWEQDPVLRAKTLVSSLLSQLRIPGKLFFEKTAFTHFHPKKQAKIVLRNGAQPLEIGTLATIHPLLLKQQKIAENAQLCMLSLNLDILKKYMGQTNNEQDYETLQDQILWRDLSFVLDADQDFGKLVEVIGKLGNIEEVKVFDLYQGANIGEGKKSISLQIKIKGDGSMTTDQINGVMQSAIQKAESIGAVLRG